MKSGTTSFVVRTTKEVIADLAGPSFHDGSGSSAWADPARIHPQRVMMMSRVFRKGLPIPKIPRISFTPDYELGVDGGGGGAGVDIFPCNAATLSLKSLIFWLTDFPSSWVLLIVEERAFTPSGVRSIFRAA